MYRRTAVFLGLVAFLTAALVFFGRFSLPRQDSPGSPNDEVSLTEYLPRHPLTPSPDHPLSLMQDMVDQISETAAEGEWSAAAQAVEQLEEVWERGAFKQERKLAIEKEITASIKSLRRHVWARDRKETLQAAQMLTELIGRLSEK